MSPAQRFNAWRVVVVGTLLADAIAATAASWAAVASAQLLLLAMAGLIATTPSDAIKLPRERSERIILGGLVFLSACAAFRSETSATAAGLVVAFVAVFALLACRIVDRTPWLVALVAWNPFWLMAFRSS